MIRVEPSLLKRSNRYAYSRLIVTFGLLVVSSLLLLQPIGAVFKLLLVAANGFMMAGFFSVMHYCCHGTFFTQKHMNRRFGQLLASAMLMNFAAYKFFHMQHHRRTTVVGDSEPAGEIRNVWQYFWYALNWDYITAFARMSIGSLFGYFPFFVRSEKACREVKVDAWLSLGFMAGMLWLTWLFPLQALLVYWLPVQLAFSLNFFYVIGEHSGVEAGDDPLQNTQTFARQNRLFSFFNHNSNFHAAHHCFPQVPPDNIPAAHKLIEEKLKYSPVGYIELNFQLLRSLLKNPLRSAPPPPPGRETSFFYKLETRNESK